MGSSRDISSPLVQLVQQDYKPLVLGLVLELIVVIVVKLHLSMLPESEGQVKTAQKLYCLIEEGIGLQ